MSGGRFELGLGAGAFWQGIEAMGGRALSRKQSVDAVEQAIVELREFWKAEGKFDGPKPAHQIGIWLGAYRPRMLRIAGALADGWVPSQSYLPPDQVPEAMKRVDDAAAAEGRDPKEIRRFYNLSSDDPATPLVYRLLATGLWKRPYSGVFACGVLVPAGRHPRLS